MSKMERLAHVGEATGLSRLIRRLGTWRGILAFTYHRVGTVDGVYDSGMWDATPTAFDRQVELLKKEFDVIGPDQLAEAGPPRRGRYVLLTFDDGYRDSFDEAFPILRRHQVPATFFVTTGFLDNPRIPWWDEIAWMLNRSRKSVLAPCGLVRDSLSLRPEARRSTIRFLTDMYKRLPREEQPALLESLAIAAGTGRHEADGREAWMTWDDVRRLRAEGMHVGGHTVSHPLLARLPADEQEREIAGCKERLETELGERMRYFSYPDGGRGSFDEDTRRCLARHGIELAFSFYGGYRSVDDWDPYDVRRCCVGITVSPQRFALMLTLPQAFARP
jgi:peptidoglycan/xylan/chitin deacetylase (PgdA/CDA1 family)